MSALIRAVANPPAGNGIFEVSIYGSSEPGEVEVGAGAGDGAGAGAGANPPIELDLGDFCNVTNAVPSPLTPLSSPPQPATAKTSKTSEFKRLLFMSIGPLTLAIRSYNIAVYG